MVGSPEKQEELDPSIEFIRKRMMRMMVLSIGILGFGLLALLFAIIYKLNTGSKDKDVEVVTQSSQEERGHKNKRKRQKLAEAIDVDIPEGARIVKNEIRRGQLILEMKHRDDTLIWIVDMHEGKVVSRITLK